LVDKNEKMKLIEKSGKFLGEVKSELKKVSWPDRHELAAATGIVVITVALLATFIWLCDTIFFWLIHLFIR